MKLVKKIATGMSTALAVVELSAMKVFATTPTDAASVLQGAGSNESVSKIGNAAKGVISSVYTGVSNIGVIISVIALIVGFIRLGVNRNSQKREMGKDMIIWACIALFLFGGAIALIGAALQVGKSATA